MLKDVADAEKAKQEIAKKPEKELNMLEQSEINFKAKKDKEALEAAEKAKKDAEIAEKARKEEAAKILAADALAKKEQALKEKEQKITLDLKK